MQQKGDSLRNRLFIQIQTNLSDNPDKLTR